MGKGLAIGDSPGASAAAEGFRAQGTATRRGLVTAGFALVALALALAGLATGHRGWFVAGGAVATFAWHLRPEPDPDRWRRGAKGEVATAHLLSRLPNRFVVLHDRLTPGSRGNVDHIVVGPSGVWVVDSKVRRARLRIHRGQVWAGNHTIDVDPVSRQAARVAEALGVAVIAVVAVHGVGLRRRGKNVEGVRILPAARVTRHLRRGRRLDRSQVAALAARADRYFPRYRTWRESNVTRWRDTPRNRS